MASLNTLRTKFGYVLSAVIAFALLAFIFSLKSDMGFTGSDPVVGELNSEELLYSEYYAEYQDVKSKSGITESTEQDAARLANAAWQSIISKKVLMPSFAQMGLVTSEAERMAIINGAVATQSFGTAFIDPTTGVYSHAALTDFLSQVGANPEAEQAWIELNNQARQERAMVKFNSLVKAGAFANKLEVANGVAAANNRYSGKWVSVPYSSIPDAEVSVSDSEIKNYYKENKALYKKQPTRSISYVTFAFDPTEQDIIDIENTALQVSKEFAAAQDLRTYVRSNLNASISDGYMAASQLADAQLKAFTAGKMYGPVNENNAWTMSRVAASIMAPDTVGIRHIVLRYDQEQLADSLYKALKAGADFAQAAMENSLYAQTAQAGGEVGLMPFYAFSGEFVEPLAKAKKGDIVKITSGDMIQIMQVYRADKAKRHYQVASVEYPVEASQATIGALHSQAGMFSVGAASSLDAFSAAANQQGVITRNAILTNGERSVRGLADSREIARWAYGAKAGALSEVFKTDGGYVVAMVTEIDNEPYRSLEAVKSSIVTKLSNEKKFAKAAEKLKGATIEEIAQAVDAEVKEFSNVGFTSQYISGMGVEPKVVGVITLTGIEGLTAPVQGNTAAYVLDIAPVEVTGEQTAQMEQVRAQAAAEGKMSQSVFRALQDMANIKDLRGEFF